MIAAEPKKEKEEAAKIVAPVVTVKKEKRKVGVFQDQDRTLLVFPGQGAQKVGMGKGLDSIPEVKQMILKAKEILGYDIWDICINGPEDKLNQTLVSQPALYLVSLAALEKLKKEDPKRLEACVCVAGLSLGEYTALTYAGVFTFEDGLRLVKARAEAMQKAAEANPSGMVSVLGITNGADKVVD